MDVHELKTWPGSYVPVAAGIKTCEFRKNDRDFKRGDLLVLREYLPKEYRYTGNVVLAFVTHVFYGNDTPEEFGIPKDYALMSIKVFDPDF